LARTSQSRRIVVARSKPDAVTSVEITWAIPSRPPAMPGEVTSTLLGIGLRPSRSSVPRLGGRSARVVQTPVPDIDFSPLVYVLGRELSLQHATKLVEREARRLTGSSLALCVFFDWTQRRAWTMQGHELNDVVNEIIAEVAGSGHAATSAHVIIEPIGRVPTRTVLLTRRDDVAYSHQDYVGIAALARSIDGPFDRLLRATTGRP
jgi:hypothetical protein